jgi:uncharacterized protein YjbI with pentapeptide repeats
VSLNKKTKCVKNNGFLFNQQLTQPNLTQPNLTQPNLTQPNLTQPNLTQPNLTQLNDNKLNIYLDEFKKLNEKISLVISSIDLINKKIDNIDQTLKNVFGETEKSNDRQFDSYCSYIS